MPSALVEKSQLGHLLNAQVHQTSMQRSPVKMPPVRANVPPANTNHSTSAFSAIVSSSGTGTAATGSPTRPTISLSAHLRHNSGTERMLSSLATAGRWWRWQQPSGCCLPVPRRLLQEGDHQQLGASFTALQILLVLVLSAGEVIRAEAPACTRAHFGGCELPQLIEGRHFHCFY